MAATESYPSFLPLPTFEGHAIEPLDAVERTDMEQGEARQTLLYTNVPDRRPCRFRFTQLEFAIFESWYRHKADRGAEWFNITLLSGLGMLTHEARFVGQGSTPYRAVPVRGDAAGAKFLVTTTLEIRDPPMLSEQALDVVIATEGDFFGLEDAINAFHQTVHVTLPGPGGWT